MKCVIDGFRLSHRRPVTVFFFLYLHFFLFLNNISLRYYYFFLETSNSKQKSKKIFDRYGTLKAYLLYKRKKKAVNNTCEKNPIVSSFVTKKMHLY